MSETNKPQQVEDGVVVSLDYTLVVDGEEVDTSKGRGPLDYLQGQGNIISGLERELAGMAVGEGKKVVVAAKDGYGEYDEDEVKDVPRDEFPQEIKAEVGVQLQMRDEEGFVVQGEIVEVGEESVKLDFNHPLAGEPVTLFVRIRKVIPPRQQRVGAVL